MLTDDDYQEHTQAISLDGRAYKLAASEYHSLRDAWMAGKAFWMGTDFWGATITIKLSRIEAVAFNTTASIRAFDEDMRIENQRRVFRGDDQ